MAGLINWWPPLPQSGKPEMAFAYGLRTFVLPALLIEHAALEAEEGAEPWAKTDLKTRCYHLFQSFFRPPRRA